MFAFPLQVGAMCLGVLDVYASQPGSLTDEQVGMALATARRATVILLDGGPGLGDAIDHRAEIYQAQGVVMVARQWEPLRRWPGCGPTPSPRT